MTEMLRPEGTGISGILELARLVIPSDHEFLGFEDDDGVFYSLEQLEALEGQEQKMDPIQKAIESLEKIVTKAPRTIKRCFHVGNTFFAIASDDTAWYLRRMDKFTGPDFWEQLHDATAPALPQNEVTF